MRTGGRRTRARSRLASTLALLLTASVLVVGEPVSPSPAGGQDSGCAAATQAGRGPSVTCIAEWATGGGSGRGGPGPGDGGSGTGGGGSGHVPLCGWAAVDYGQDMGGDPGEWPEGDGSGPIETENPGDWGRIRDEFQSLAFSPEYEGHTEQWWWFHCSGDPCPLILGSTDDDGAGLPGGGVLCPVAQTVARTMVPPGVPTPSPGVPVELHLLHRAFLLAEALMAEPELDMRPPEGTPTVVQMPTFVEVTNWSDDWDAGETDPRDVCMDPEPPSGPVCVTLTWENELWYQPGEAGAPERGIECDPPGTSYDADDPRDPMDVAGVDGACTYTYLQHTREAAYEGEVRVDWLFDWYINGESAGSFDPFPQATSFERTVDEVQTTTDGFDGGPMSERRPEESEVR